MSVSDPLLKDLKGCLQQLITSEQILDSNPLVLSLCELLERCFNKGLVIRSDISSSPSPWIWLNTVEVEMQRGGISRVFSYVRCVEEARTNARANTNRGKFRLLLRLCLIHKCLHVPIDIMVRQIGNRKNNWYDSSSILSHEVLGEILLSVALQLSHLNFCLDISNARFLDMTWQLPEVLKTTFVPCLSLGIVVTFLDDFAVIVEIEKGSVAAEDNKIEAGDILDELNGEIVTEQLRGQLKNILSKCRNQPIDVKMLKIHCKSPQASFSPCVRLFRSSSKLVHLCHQSPNRLKRREEKNDLWYLGNCSMGARGDMTQVEKGVRNVKASDQVAVSVIVQFRELDLQVFKDGNLLLKHSFVTIASCGQSINYPYHFAYLVGNGPCSSETEYTCHVFRAFSKDVCNSMLLSLNLGFERTKCTV